MTVMVGIFKLSNGQTTEETEMILVHFHSIFIFFQTNDKTIVFDIIGKFGFVSKGVCGDDKMNPKTDNSFNDPFCVGTLIFQLRGKIFGS